MWLQFLPDRVPVVIVVVVVLESVVQVVVGVYIWPVLFFKQPLELIYRQIWQQNTRLRQFKEPRCELVVTASIQSVWFWPVASKHTYDSYPQILPRNRIKTIKSYLYIKSVKMNGSKTIAVYVMFMAVCLMSSQITSCELIGTPHPSRVSSGWRDMLDLIVEKTINS